jgi:hypothetical protein
MGLEACRVPHPRNQELCCHGNVEVLSFDYKEATMQSITLSTSTGLVLMLPLAISDGWLVHSVRKQKAALDTFAVRQALFLLQLVRCFPRGPDAA